MKQYLLDAESLGSYGVATIKICIILTIGAVVGCAAIARAVVRGVSLEVVLQASNFRTSYKLQ